jgi:hypothetical protein
MADRVEAAVIKTDAAAIASAEIYPRFARCFENVFFSGPWARD